MFRSLIEEKIRFWHVWMDTIYPVLPWPSSVLLGVAAGPPCPLGCVRSAWKQQIRRSLGAEHLGSSAGGLDLCAWGEPHGYEELLCAGQSFCAGGKHPRGSLSPLCFENCLPPLHGRGVSPIQHGCRLVFPSKMVCLAAGRGFTGCRNNFSGSAFLRFYLFVWRMLELCKSLKKTTLDTQLLKWRKMSTKLEKWGKAPRNTLEFSGGVGSR